MYMFYVIYDEKCTFCTKFASWISSKNDMLITLPVRGSLAKSKLKDKGVHFICLKTIYFIQNDVVYTKSLAIFNIFKNLNYPYKLLSYLNIFPIFLTDYIYSLFSKYRYKI